MRIRITFKVANRGSVVPFHHQPIIAQLLKGFLLGSTYETFTTFSFSGLKGQTNVGREGLFIISSKVTVVISSSHPDFIQFLVSRIFEHDEISISALKVVPESVDQEEPPLFSGSEKFVCISPILLLHPAFNSSEGKQFIMPDHDPFSDHLFDVIMKRMYDQGINTSKIEGVERFQVVPDSEYLFKLKNANKKFSRIYSFYDQDVMYESRGYTFPFVLHAAPEIISFAYTHGLGHYSHKGFGMIDLASIEPARKTTPYPVPALKIA